MYQTKVKHVLKGSISQAFSPTRSYVTKNSGATARSDADRTRCSDCMNAIEGSKQQIHTRFDPGLGKVAFFVPIYDALGGQCQELTNLPRIYRDSRQRYCDTSRTYTSSCLPAHLAFRRLGQDATKLVLAHQGTRLRFEFVIHISLATLRGPQISLVFRSEVKSRRSLLTLGLQLLYIRPNYSTAP